MLAINRYQRRLLSRLRMNYPARERVLLTRAVDSLAMAGLVEYEASDFHSTKKNINQYVYVWLSPIPNRIHYSVCEMCANRNAELLDTVCQLEAYLVEANKNLQYNEALAAARIKELEQNNDLLTEECNSLHDILNATGSNMAKFNLDIKNVTLGGNVVVGDAIISVEVPDDLFTACVNNLTKLTEIMFSPPKSTCTCHANDEDKRPPESKGYVIRHTGKTSGSRNNSFAPMDVE